MNTALALRLYCTVHLLANEHTLLSSIGTVEQSAGPACDGLAGTGRASDTELSACRRLYTSPSSCSNTGRAHTLLTRQNTSGRKPAGGAPDCAPATSSALGRGGYKRSKAETNKHCKVSRIRTLKSIRIRIGMGMGMERNRTIQSEQLKAVGEQQRSRVVQSLVQNLCGVLPDVRLLLTHEH